VVFEKDLLPAFPQNGEPAATRLPRQCRQDAADCRLAAEQDPFLVRAIFVGDSFKQLNYQYRNDKFRQWT
jgi:hypothetical protein